MLSIKHSPAVPIVSYTDKAVRAARPQRVTKDLLESALSHLTDADDYDPWTQTGLCLKDTVQKGEITDEEGRELFHKYSSRSDKYDPVETNKKWDGFKPTSITVGTLFWKAKQNGWCPTINSGGAPPAYYVNTSNGISRRGRQNSDVMLSNFAPRIVGQSLLDDGSGTQKRIFNIECDGFRPCYVPAEEFEHLRWIRSAYGARAIISAANGSKQHFAAAIQFLSGDAPEEFVYAHSGWRRVNGEYFFLHSDGAIGAKGVRPDIKVQLEGTLKKCLLQVGNAADAIDAIHQSLKVLELLPLDKACMLLAVTYLAPLGEFIKIDFIFFIEGMTGLQKTAIASIGQAHYGAEWTNGRNPPENWHSTANALQYSTFLYKDILLLVDDFCPAGNIKSQDLLYGTAERLIRSIGNKSGRKRMNSKGGQMPDYYPRGLVVSTAEDCPKGQSLNARMLIMNIEAGDVNLDILSELQEAGESGILTTAIAGYVQYLALRAPDLRSSLQSLHTQLRKEFQAKHARISDNMATLMLGLRCFLDYAQHIKAVNEDKSLEIWENAKCGVQQLAQAVNDQIRTEDPIINFFELLKIALAGGMAHLESAKGGCPSEVYRKAGWKMFGGENGDFVPSGKRIGWIDEDNFYLWMESAYLVARQHAQISGASMAVSQKKLMREMARRDMLLSKDEGRNNTRRLLGGQREYVMHLSLCQTLGFTINSALPDNNVI